MALRLAPQLLRTWVQEIDMGVSINVDIKMGWFIMENPIKMDDLKVPLFQETTI